MASQGTTFEKIQRDRAKKAKAEAKRARRLGQAPGPVDNDPRPRGDTTPTDPSQIRGTVSPQQLLMLCESLQTQLQSGTITQEEFDAKKADLLARLPK